MMVIRRKEVPVLMTPTNKIVDLDIVLKPLLERETRMSPARAIEEATQMDVLEVVLSDRFIVRFMACSFDLEVITPFTFVWKTFNYEVYAIQEGMMTLEDGSKHRYNEVIFRKQDSRAPNEQAMREAMTLLANDFYQRAKQDGMSNVEARTLAKKSLSMATDKVDINSVLINEDEKKSTYVFERNKGRADGQNDRQIIHRPTQGELTRNQVGTRLRA